VPPNVSDDGGVVVDVDEESPRIVVEVDELVLETVVEHAQLAKAAPNSAMTTPMLLDRLIVEVIVLAGIPLDDRTELAT
jgi:hypothetical protein